MIRFKCSCGRGHQRREDLAKARTRAGSKKDRLHGQFDRIANAMENAVVLSMTRGIATFKRRIDADEIERLFTEGRFEDAVDVAPWEDLSDDLTRVGRSLEPVALAGSRFALKTLPAPAKNLRISPNNPNLRRFIDSQIGNLIVDISAESRKSVQFAVSESFRQALNPKRAAKIIKRSVGISEKQNQRIMRARQNESAQRALLREKLTQLRRDGKGLSKTARNTQIKLRTLTDRAIDRRVEQRIAAAEKNRSIVIARTEITNAMNEGQAVMWDEAANQGLIDRTEAKKSWVTVPDADRSEVCSELSGQKVGMDDEFWSDVLGQSFSHPPAHPNCRSSVILEP